MMNVRVRSVASIAILLSLGGGSIYLGVKLFGDYFAFGNSINFIWFSSVLFLAPAVFTLPIFFFVLVLMLNYSKATEMCAAYIKLYKKMLLLLLAISVSFPFVYLNLLERKGYISCKGIPSGYMPGIGKKYVTDPRLCK